MGVKFSLISWWICNISPSKSLFIMWLKFEKDTGAVLVCLESISSLLYDLLSGGNLIWGISGVEGANWLWELLSMFVMSRVTSKPINLRLSAMVGYLKTICTKLIFTYLTWRRKNKVNNFFRHLTIWKIYLFFLQILFTRLHLIIVKSIAKVINYCRGCFHLCWVKLCDQHFKMLNFKMSVLVVYNFENYL